MTTMLHPKTTLVATLAAVTTSTEAAGMILVARISHRNNTPVAAMMLAVDLGVDQTTANPITQLHMLLQTVSSKPSQFTKLRNLI
ncbi:hypothetical protein QBC44DRAFT_328733 [Cladorrhinum sp. PSN332]|nr:hypothetical protein QBC44DRAFT_328733 [Cladorrhinum sp. PSN332]